MKMFAKIQEYLSNPEVLVIILIDEVCYVVSQSYCQLSCPLVYIRDGSAIVCKNVCKLNAKLNISVHATILRDYKKR